MHVLCASDANLTDSLKAAIAACDEVYFEINLSDMIRYAEFAEVYADERQQNPYPTC
jgi:hypothetical protein